MEDSCFFNKFVLFLGEGRLDGGSPLGLLARHGAFCKAVGAIDGCHVLIVPH